VDITCRRRETNPKRTGCQYHLNGDDHFSLDISPGHNLSRFLYILAAWRPSSSLLLANSFIVGDFFVIVRLRLVTAVHLNKGVMCDATIFPVIPHFLADKGIWIFARNVAPRADIAPSRQHFFHFHLRILSCGVLASRNKKLKIADFLLAGFAYAIPK